jgi:hypothetical protein
MIDPSQDQMNTNSTEADTGREKPKRKPKNNRQAPHRRRRTLVAFLVAVLVVPLLFQLLANTLLRGYERSAVLDMLIIGVMICLAVFIGYNLLRNLLANGHDTSYYAAQHNTDRIDPFDEYDD